MFIPAKYKNFALGLNRETFFPRKFLPLKYKRALIIPVVDTFISEMTHRFIKFNCKAAKLLILAPSVLCSEKFNKNVDISPILEEYEEDLINRDVADQELLLW